MYARITTDPQGHLFDGSTCTIDGDTVAVPIRTERAGGLAASRIIEAIRALGWQPADYFGTLTQHDGYVRVRVKRAGA